MDPFSTLLISISSNIVSHCFIKSYPKIEAFFRDRFTQCNIISEKDLVETPSRQVIVNTTEGLLKTDDERLQNCYLKLLKTTYHNGKQNLVHPSFPFIIDQISHDEAWMLYYLKQGDKRLRQEFLFDEDYSKFLPPTILFNELKTQDLFFQDNYNLYQSQLTHMNLIHNYENQDKRKILYRPIDKNTPQNKILTNNDTQEKTVQYGVEQEYVFSLTEFGELFVEACIPDDTDIEQFNYMKKYQPK